MDWAQPQSQAVAQAPGFLSSRYCLECLCAWTWGLVTREIETQQQNCRKDNPKDPDPSLGSQWSQGRFNNSGRFSEQDLRQDQSRRLTHNPKPRMRHGERTSRAHGAFGYLVGGDTEPMGISESS